MLQVKLSIAVLGTLIFALALAGLSAAGLSPKLSVSATQGAAGKLSLAIGDANPVDSALGEIKVVVPSGYTFAAQPGSGTVSGTAVWVQRDPDTPLAMAGSISPVSTSDSRVSTSATGCDATPHLAAWLVSMTGGGDSLTFPVFVDATSGSDTSIGSYAIVACFPSLSSQGTQFVSATLQILGFTAPKAGGTFTWHSLLTPFASDGTTLNTSGNVEAQNTQVIQTNSLSLAHKLTNAVIHGKRIHRVTLSGTLTAAGKPVANAIVAIRHGSTKKTLIGLGSTKTNANGRWTKTVTLTSSQYFQAGTTIKTAATACTSAFGAPCLSATGGTTAVTTAIAHVTA